MSAGLFLILALLWPAHLLAANEHIPEPLVGPDLFEGFDKKAKASGNISGITCPSHDICILVADEMIAVQKIGIDAKGNEFRYQPGPHFGSLFSKFCKSVAKRKGCDEVDLEAIAGDGDGIWVTGSMGNASRSGKREKKRWFLARFSLDEKGKPAKSTLAVQNKRKVLREVFAQHPEIEPHIEKPLQCGGLNVEGFAQVNDRIFFGLRGPALLKNGKALVLEASVVALSASKKSEIGKTKLHVLDFRDSNGDPIRNTGIRALEEIDGRLLIATGRSQVSAPRTFDHLEEIESKCKGLVISTESDVGKDAAAEVPRIWLWDPGSKKPPIELVRLGGDYADEKLEGLAVLSPAGSNKVNLILTIDDPDDVPPLAILRELSLPE